MPLKGTTITPIDAMRVVGTLARIRLGSTIVHVFPRRFIMLLQLLASQKHYLFIPIPLLLLVLGTILFLVKSSALAPFIYALF
jgi:hypothetical protein